MGVYGRLDFNILHLKEDPNLSEFVDVCGKVVANSKFTFGKYKSQEIVLFDKNPDQYEKLHLGKGKNLLSFSGSRCWVVAQACSLLNSHIDLVNPQKEIILKQDVELETCSSYGSCKEFVSGKYFVSVHFSWFTTSLQPPKGSLLIRSLEPCTPDLPQPRPASAIEVFSVLLVCHEKPLQIHGYLRFTSDRKSDVYETGIDIFKREKDHPLALKGSGLHTISVSNGSRLLADFKTLSMACDLEDAMACDLEDTRNKSSIKGLEYLDMKRYAGQQLCSIFQGNYGFAALHYTVFPSAVQVKVVKVNFREQKGLQCDVFGSICAQYKGFDYSSQYKKDCYRIVLFKRDMGDSAKMDVDGLIPLSKSTFVVPSPSSAMLDLNLMIGSRKFSSVIDISMGIGNRIGEYTERIIEGEFEFVLEWREVK